MSYSAVQTQEGMKMVCGWFAMCDNPTEKATDHPVLGPVPICPRCAEKMGIEPELDIEVQVEQEG